MKFVKNTTYYTGTVYEWNLPAGVTCPGALQCKVSVDHATGKFTNESTEFRCYAAAAERFPAVRDHRWANYKHCTDKLAPVIPGDAKAVRIHASGDFYSQDYFDMWLQVCRDHPDVEFWAFTKSIPFWNRRIASIPDNLVLTASMGGKWDELAITLDLKRCWVVRDRLPVDTNDDLARQKEGNFVLLDNNGRKKK